MIIINSEPEAQLRFKGEQTLKKPEQGKMKTNSRLVNTANQKMPVPK